MYATLKYIFINTTEREREMTTCHYCTLLMDKGETERQRVRFYQACSFYSENSLTTIIKLCLVQGRALVGVWGIGY